MRVGRLGLVGALACLALVPASAASRPAEPTLALSVGPGPPTFKSELWLVRANGTGPRRVVGTKRVGIEDPAWSPDGRRVAFVVVRDPISRGSGSIVVARADGTHRHVVASGFAPAWSPDGRTVAFARTGKTGAAIWLIRPDGGGRRLLTAGLDPAWSPDGKRLVLARDGWIVVVNRDGSGVRQLTAPPSGCDMPDPDQYGVDADPDWGPGGRIAFVRSCDELSAGSYDRIFVVRADGTGLHALTQGPDDASPSWSPDGRALAFVRDLALFTVRSDATHARRVFAPRGREVYSVAWLRRHRA